MVRATSLRSKTNIHPAFLEVVDDLDLFREKILVCLDRVELRRQLVQFFQASFGGLDVPFQSVYAKIDVTMEGGNDEKEGPEGRRSDKNLSLQRSFFFRSL